MLGQSHEVPSAVWGVAAVAVLVGLAVVAVRVRAAAQVIGWRRRLGP